MRSLNQSSALPKKSSSARSTSATTDGGGGGGGGAGMQLDDEKKLGVMQWVFAPGSSNVSPHVQPAGQHQTLNKSLQHVSADEHVNSENHVLHVGPRASPQRSPPSASWTAFGIV